MTKTSRFRSVQGTFSQRPEPQRKVQSKAKSEQGDTRRSSRTKNLLPITCFILLALVGYIQNSLLTAGTERRQKSNLDKRNPVPTPIIVVGLPKSGTTSIHNYFKCAGVERASHYCCTDYAADIGHPPCIDPEERKNGKYKGGDGRCCNCIKKNVAHKRPPLEGCGNFDVFAQMDCEMRDDERFDPEKRVNRYVMYLPQIVALDEIHKHYPSATFILNVRDPQKWSTSVKNWFNLRGIFKNTNIPQIGYKRGETNLVEFYEDHLIRIRKFVKEHPSHLLVEVNIEDENAGKVMEDVFGHRESCWGHSNKMRKKNETKTTTEEIDEK